MKLALLKRAIILRFYFVAVAALSVALALPPIPAISSSRMEKQLDGSHEALAARPAAALFRRSPFEHPFFLASALLFVEIAAAHPAPAHAPLKDASLWTLSHGFAGLAAAALTRFSQKAPRPREKPLEFASAAVEPFRTERNIVWPRHPTPADDLMVALGLTKGAAPRGLQNEFPLADAGGYTVKRVSLSSTHPPSFRARGIEIYRNDLILGYRLQAMDLLYNDAGELIALFPVVPKSDIGFMRSLMRKRPANDIHEAYGVHYVDVSFFNVELPRFGAADSLARWRRFARSRRSDAHAIRTYHRRFLQGLPVDRLNRRHGPYAYIAIGRDGGWTAKTFNPDTLLRNPRALPPEISGAMQLIIPVLPGIYSPAAYYDEDRSYYEHAYRYFLERGHRVLLVGPGSGSDTYLAAKRTGEAIYVVAPTLLEAASCLGMANLANVPVIVRVADNAVDSNGKSWFTGKFDRAMWAGPALWTERDSTSAEGLRELWDGTRKALARFSKGMPALLRRGTGRGLLWTSDAAPKVPTVTGDAYRRRILGHGRWNHHHEIDRAVVELVPIFQRQLQTSG
jgi:hypothetical protein